MSSPITGPIVTTHRTPATGKATYKKEQQKWRQKKPYNLQLEYIVQTKRNGVVVVGSGTQYGDASASFNSMDSAASITDLHFSGDPNIPSFVSIRDDARNKALARFNSKRGERAALGVALAEAGSSLGMIANRARQIGGALNAVRKLRFGDAARLLGLTRDARWHKLSKSDRLRQEAGQAANNWLEFSFGWKPLVGDMYSAIQVLDAPLMYDAPVRVSSSISKTLTFGSIGPGQQWSEHKCFALCVIGAVLSVTNPNKDLAARMGLTNPFAIGFELIPWSFVLNWFVNCEEYLNQFNEYYGVSVERPFYGDVFNDDASILQQHWSGNPAFSNAGTASAKSFWRHPGSLPSVTLGLRPAWRLSAMRAANAVSLLIQQGRRLR